MGRGLSRPEFIPTRREGGIFVSLCSGDYTSPSLECGGSTPLFPALSPQLSSRTQSRVLPAASGRKGCRGNGGEGSAFPFSCRRCPLCRGTTRRARPRPVAPGFSPASSLGVRRLDAAFSRAFSSVLSRSRNPRPPHLPNARRLPRPPRTQAKKQSSARRTRPRRTLVVAVREWEEYPPRVNKSFVFGGMAGRSDVRRFRKEKKLAEGSPTLSAQTAERMGHPRDLSGSRGGHPPSRFNELRACHPPPSLFRQ